MKQKEFNEAITNIQNKLGKENASSIADDLAKLISDNDSMNKTIDKKENEFNELQGKYETVIEANGNLLQQVSIGYQEPKKLKQDEEDKNKSFSYKDVFDEKGEFIK